MAVILNAYATLDDLKNIGISPGFFTGDLSPSTDAINQSLNNAKAYIDSIISVSDKITLPLAEPYDPNLVQSNAAIAMWNLLAVRGYNPDNPTDAHIRIRWEDAVKWLDKIANGRAKLMQVTQNRPEGVQPDVLCNEGRGLRNWSGTIGNNGWIILIVAGSLMRQILNGI